MEEKAGDMSNTHNLKLWKFFLSSAYQIAEPSSFLASYSQWCQTVRVYVICKNINELFSPFLLCTEARNTFANAVGRKESFGFGDSEEFHHLRSSLLEMKNEIEKHNTAMAQIIDDQNKKQLHLDALYSHVDQLENLKADKQQINREIEVKADRRELEKKVSHDKFQGSLSCLDQSVQDLVEKLVGHVSIPCPL